LKNWRWALRKREAVPFIYEQSADFVQGLIEDAIEKGATLLSGNKREHNLIYPNILDHVAEDMVVDWEEPFRESLKMKINKSKLT
jgi:acyl-CoA reductase-like NAD-dependent aldehyde dehydrogenase